MQEAALKYVRKLREVKYQQQLFDLLARQYEAAKVDEARQGAFVQVVDIAVPPDQRSSPKPLLIIPGAIVFGAFVMLLWILAKEAWLRLKANPKESSRLATLRAVMGRPS